MRDTDWTPSIVPGDEDRDVCLVVNDFGRRGRTCNTAERGRADGFHGPSLLQRHRSLAFDPRRIRSASRLPVSHL
jgi:hypothetical protein